MKQNKIIFFLLLVISCTSCYTSKISYKYLNSIQRGMSPKEVLDILGEPDYRSFDAKGEVFEFRSSEYGTAKTVKIWFVNDKVVEMKSYLDKYDGDCHHEEKDAKNKEKDSNEENASFKIQVTTHGK